MLEMFFLAASLACGAHQEIVDWLEMQHSELLTHQTINSSGNLLEVFRSQKGETWTILLTAPKGLACVIDTGANWRDISPDWLELDPKT